ncbi:peptidyl-prolyl cis-trans isomerase [Deinococcus sp. Marseille-Q6407]|uniref:peptidyl-prolyl cis-trans isomerase n=1 Tax=Deinococcus sp. Marseille-Q6407 TaxID=2969223 RepID=UPI0021BEC49F|nr:peptidyl-prolyl cis-trans isomerase [Deinococcus sp. Marseille-Q6407]
MNKKTAVNALLIVLSLLLVGGMALQFLPGDGAQNIMNSIRGEKGTPAIRVNGKAITAEKLKSIEQNNPSPFKAQGGVLQDDFRTFLISQVIRQEVMTQAAGDINVTRQDVDAEVTKVREDNKLTDNAAWTDALQRVGLSDSEYRQQVKEGLALQRQTEEIEKSAPAPTEDEMKTYYDLNPTLFQTEQRIKGREIVLDDQAQAQKVLAQARGGADFAELARKNSKEENAASGGALGALGEKGALQPVETVVLPDEVAKAVQSLPSPGLTEVVASGGRFYIVKVEELLPPQTKPYEQVKADVKTALEKSKKAAAVEQFMDQQLAAAKIEVVDPAWKYEDPTVAEVNGKKIPYSEVVGRVLQNQQLMMMVQGMNGGQLGDMVNGMLKPSVVEQLIREYAAPTIVQQEGVKVVGTRQDLVSGLIAYGGRDVKVSDQELRKAYEEGKAQFQVPGSAAVSEATFPSREQALAFRQDWQGGDFTKAATKAGGIVSERGTIHPDSDTLDPSVLQAIFEGKLRAVGDTSLTDIVQAKDGWKVVSVADLQPGRVLPFDEVRNTLETSLFNEKQGTKGEEFLSGKVAAFKPVNHLKEVLDAQKARVAAEAPATASGAATSGAATSETTSGAAASEAATTPAENESASGAQAAPAEGSAAATGQ